MPVLNSKPSSASHHSQRKPEPVTWSVRACSTYPTISASLLTSSLTTPRLPAATALAPVFPAWNTHRSPCLLPCGAFPAHSASPKHFLLPSPSLYFSPEDFLSLSLLCILLTSSVIAYFCSQKFEVQESRVIFPFWSLLSPYVQARCLPHKVLNTPESEALRREVCWPLGPSAARGHLCDSHLKPLTLCPQDRKAVPQGRFRESPEGEIASPFRNFSHGSSQETLN